MRLAALLFAMLAGCASLPPVGTPYFETMTSGDNLYPATQTRIYATDQRVDTHAPHPLNNNNGLRRITAVPGAFDEGVAAFATLPRSSASTDSTNDQSNACCHAFVARSYSYFDGQTRHATSEAVWRRAAGIPPFVDQPVFEN